MKMLLSTIPQGRNNLRSPVYPWPLSQERTVAIVGPSGAGKSTIFALLLRFYDPEKGTVKLDNLDIKNLVEDDFRSQIALVPQDTMIFASSAAENISYGRPTASRNTVIAAAKAANAHDFIEKMPEGYENHFWGETWGKHFQAVKDNG